MRSPVPLLLLALTIGSVRSEANQKGAPDLELQSTARPPVQFHSVTTKPTAGDIDPKAFHSLPTPVKLPDGRLIVSVGVQAWFDGSRVRIRTMLVSPKNPDAFSRPLNFDEHAFIPLVDFDLQIGESRRLDELQKLGATPVTIRVFPPGHIKH